MSSRESTDHPASKESDAASKVSDDEGSPTYIVTDQCRCPRNIKQPFYEDHKSWEEVPDPDMYLVTVMDREKGNEVHWYSTGAALSEEQATARQNACDTVTKHARARFNVSNDEDADRCAVRWSQVVEMAVKRETKGGSGSMRGSKVQTIKWPGNWYGDTEYKQVEDVVDAFRAGKIDRWGEKVYESSASRRVFSVVGRNDIAPRMFSGHGEECG